MDKHPSGMDIVDEFVDRYPKEIDYYDQVARMVARKLEAALAGAGLRAIVTSRAKSFARLKDKLIQRNAKEPYTSISGVYADIADLAGVRVALYFPGERDQVGKVIKRLFAVYDEKQKFPAENANLSWGRRFSGYSAVHYRVNLSSNDTEDSEQRYSEANVEIQVASVLMHAWSEVEHDLVYKPEAALSQQEYSLLDQLNGLMLAGEISLEQLQRAGEARVAETGRAFQNHYDLAAHLLGTASRLDIDDIDDSGLGRVDLLFALLDYLERKKPEDLEPYLQLVHSNLEQRPLAEQIIDALLSENESLYAEYQRIREQVIGMSTAPKDLGAIHQGIGEFLAAWVALEKLMSDLVPNQEPNRHRYNNLKRFTNSAFLDSETSFVLKDLRAFRNRLVHGMEVPSVEQLRTAAEGVKAIQDELKRKI